MRVTIKRQDDIIEAPDNSATLEEVTNDGFFLYKIRYAVDPRKASINNALKVKIHISNKPYEKKVIPMFSGQSPETIVDNVLLRPPKIKDLARNSDKYLLSIISDISSRIPNDRTQQLSFGNGTVSLGFDRIITPMSIESLNDRNVNPPVLEMNLNTWSIIETPTANSQEIQNISNSLLHEQYIDPASVVNDRSNTFVSARDVFSGIKPETSFLQRNVSKNHPNVVRLIESLLNSNNVSNKSQLNETEIINVVKQQEQSILIITEDVRIPSVILADGDFYCIFEVINDVGLVIQTVSSFENHAKNLKLLRIPVEPPIVKMQTVNNFGKVIFNVTQKDKNGLGVNIFRRKMNPGLPQINSLYTFIGKVDLVAGQTARLEDNAASVYPILYRFIPYSNEDNQAPVFTSTIARFKGTVQNIKEKRRPYFVVMSYDLNESSISIQISKVPAGVVAVELLRRNSTIRQESFDVVKNTVHLTNFTTHSLIILVL